MDPVNRNALRGVNPTANYYSMVRGVISHVYLGAVGRQMRVKSFTLEAAIALSAACPISQSFTDKVIFINLDWHLNNHWSLLVEVGTETSQFHFTLY